EKYVDILPGGEDEIIEDGGKIQDTVSPIDLEELIAKYIFGKV
ncbi:MAG: outer membrane lipid asymmetry maintenance protein MlaD, partial [Deltaproteobacteria bacterium]|nr:outer membrane lipid asymmetry maintenance protein MlaD [Deltaproteobacteria bacterium]